MDEDDAREWQQHFPTYQYRDRDIVLLEYDAATRSLESDERVFLNATNVVLLVVAALASFAFGSLEKIQSTLTPVLPLWLVGVVLCLNVVIFTLTALRYFAARAKAVVMAARKIIVLRRMLGLSYGRLQLVLPNWRVEGASEPFAIRMFPGWRSYVAYPYWIVVAFSATVLVFVLAGLLSLSEEEWPTKFMPPGATVIAVGAIWVAFCTLSYRRALFDEHENWYLSVARLGARILKVRLAGNMEYVLYRAQLARHELERLQIDVSELARFAVFIEDRLFEKHNGVSLRAIVRAVRSHFGRRRRSGGSTITQQLARTLVVKDIHKAFRRKILEFPLAFWLEFFFTKAEILGMYLAAVRYDRGVFGAAAARQHFFHTAERRVGGPEAFVLVERIGNVNSRLLAGRVRDLLGQAEAQGLLTRVECREVVDVYARLTREGKIRPRGSSREDLLAWGSGLVD